MIKIFNFESVNCFASNTYVVYDDKICVIIDLGTCKKQLINFINENKLEVVGILLTHGHYDHIAGIDEFVKHFPNIKVYIDKNDAELLNDSSANCSKLFQENFKLSYSNIQLINNFDCLEFSENFKFEVYETPYHTNGSVCYLLKSENALFVGDSLFKNSIGRDDLPTSNSKLRKGSLEIIKSFDKNLIVYPGHGPITKLSDEIKNNYYLQ